MTKDGSSHKPPTASPKKRPNWAIAHGILPWLMLVPALMVSIVWQWDGRAHQHLDIGAPLDDGHAIFFYAAERSSADPKLNFRWSEPSSELRLPSPPPAVPLMLGLRMLAPTQPDGAQHVTVAIDKRPLTSVMLSSQMRTYRLLVVTTGQEELSIGLKSPPLQLPGETRALGVAVDSVTIDAFSGPTTDALLGELWVQPFLPLGLLLLAACGLLLRLSPLLIGALPALGMGTLVALDYVLHDARLQIAATVVA